MEREKINIYTDGGARGNPGPAAIGVFIKMGSVEKKYSETIGETTNNVAEYKAVIFALKKVKQLIGNQKIGVTEIKIHTDSELIFKQIGGLYRVKDANLKLLFMEVWNLKQDFKKVEFMHIRRELNKEADKLVNHALDAPAEGESMLFSIGE
jgi:ribonuclease HI